MFKKKIAAAGITLGLGLVGAAQAGGLTFTFQPCGNGSCAVAGAGLLDWAPGNTLALGGAGGGQLLPVGAKVSDLFQANLGGVQDPLTNTLFANGGGGNYFTVVAGFGEVVTAAFAGPTEPVAVGSHWFGGNNFAFDPASSANNFFKVYANTSGVGNNLTGGGFTAGKLILSGHITSVFSQETIDPKYFTTDASGFPSIKPCGLLDQSPNGNQLGPVGTICVGGSSNVTSVVDFADANYFPDLPVGTATVFAFTNSSLITPYNQVDPSLNFSSDGVTSADFPSNIGPLNGLTGPNFQFQADANSSFVPEPGSLAMLGLGLAGIGALRRKGQQ